ncbi:hypothetical protein F2Q69_00050913 [Brassica cretica]|uniref:Uncharacterized protein n=1 Tax=Brassica cretica TaxID=69181 RepID=A0A8S9PLQ7_BRACR|nr:hypothetical protein F2Q69_00050913 [Brassica cretica]
MSGDKLFPQTLSELPFHRRPRSIFGDGFFSDGDCMHVTCGCGFSASIHHRKLYSSLIHRRSFYFSEIHRRSSSFAACMVVFFTSGAACSIRKYSGALGSVLERPAVSSMIGYTTLTYVLRDSPRRSVHLAVRAWDDLLETAARTGQTRRDPQGYEPAAEGPLPEPLQTEQTPYELSSSKVASILKRLEKTGTKAKEKDERNEKVLRARVKRLRRGHEKKLFGERSASLCYTV